MTEKKEKDSGFPIPMSCIRNEQRRTRRRKTHTVLVPEPPTSGFDFYFDVHSRCNLHCVSEQVSERAKEDGESKSLKDID